MPILYPKYAFWHTFSKNRDLLSNDHNMRTFKITNNSKKHGNSPFQILSLVPTMIFIHVFPHLSPGSHIVSGW